MKPFTCFSEFSYLLTLLTCLLLLIYSSDIRRFDRKPWHCCFPRPISIFPPFITEISLKKHEKCSFLVNQRIWWIKCMWLTVKHDLPQQVAICQQAKRMRRMRMRGGIQKKSITQSITSLAALARNVGEGQTSLRRSTHRRRTEENCKTANGEKLSWRFRLASSLHRATAGSRGSKGLSQNKTTKRSTHWPGQWLNGVDWEDSDFINLFAHH